MNPLVYLFLICLVDISGCDEGDLPPLIDGPSGISVPVVYTPSESSTFQVVADEYSGINFLDGASLKGYVGEDVASIGDYYVLARFGAVTEASESWQGGGIMGLAFSKPASLLRSLPHELVTPSIPQSRPGFSTIKTRLLPAPVFSIAIEHSAESGFLSFGDYDPTWVADGDTITWHDILPEPGSDHSGKFTVAIESVSVAIQTGSVTRDIDILLPRSKSSPMTAIVDSGASCLVFPSGRTGWQDQYLQDPGDRVDRFYRPGLTMSVRLRGGRTVTMHDTIPICTLEQDVVILGIPFLRGLLAVHDINPSRPRLGLAKLRDVGDTVSDGRRLLSKPSQPHLSLSPLPMPHGTAKYRIRPLQDDREGSSQAMERESLLFTTELLLGEPGQRVQVIVDSGSSELHVFTTKASLDIYVPMIVMGFLCALLLGSGCVCAICGKRHWVSKKREVYKPFAVTDTQAAPGVPAPPPPKPEEFIPGADIIPGRARAKTHADAAQRVSWGYKTHKDFGAKRARAATATDRGFSRARPSSFYGTNLELTVIKGDINTALTAEEQGQELADAQDFLPDRAGQDETIAERTRQVRARAPTDRRAVADRLSRHVRIMDIQPTVIELEEPPRGDDSDEESELSDIPIYRGSV